MRKKLGLDYKRALKGYLWLGEGGWVGGGVEIRERDVFFVNFNKNIWDKSNLFEVKTMNGRI